MNYTNQSQTTAEFARIFKAASLALLIGVTQAWLSVCSGQTLPTQSTQIASTAPIRTAERIGDASTDSGLSPGAKEAAQLLGIYDDVLKLQNLHKGGWQKDGTISDEELGLKVHLLDRITYASLEVRVVADRIDRELSWSYTNQGALMARRNKNMDNLFTLNFMQGGIIGTIAGRENLIMKPEVGNRLLLITSCIGLGLSGASLLYSKVPSFRKIDGGSTILTRVFDLETFEPKKTDIVFRYLNAPDIESPDRKIRRQVLIDTWKREHYLGSGSEREERKLAAVDGSGLETVKLIGSRLRMLHDTQSSIERLDEQLLDLLRAIDVD